MTPEKFNVGFDARAASTTALPTTSKAFLKMSHEDAPTSNDPTKDPNSSEALEVCCFRSPDETNWIHIHMTVADQVSASTAASQPTQFAGQEAGVYSRPGKPVERMCQVRRTRDRGDAEGGPASSG